MVYNLRFFSSKFSLFHNSNVFGSCIIHILYTGCAKIKKNNSGAKRLKSVSFHRCSILIFIDMLLLAEGQAGEAWDPPKKQICSSDFRTGHFLTFPLGDRLSPSAKRRQASRSILLRAWPQGFHAQKRIFLDFLKFLQRCWRICKSPEMPSV